MNKENLVWVVDDDRSIRWVLERALSRADIPCQSFSSAEALLSALKKQTPAVIISDIRMEGIDGLELLARLRNEKPLLPIIIMTAHSDLDSAVAAFQGGAYEYLAKPFDINEATELVMRALAYQKEHLNILPTEAPPETEIIGEAPAMQEVFRAIGRLSQSNITVLINGASGTGKELVANALHRHSPRRDKPFIALNMAAIPRDLIESELFGHEKGAFSGAQNQRRGRFEQADGGTLFLDEIGDMPPESQTRLLRVLAEGEFYRIGGHTAIQVDVRIIAATHQNLEQQVVTGHFREDLFHRLNVIRLQLPKLSERQQDIPKLLDFFLHKAAQELNVEPKVIDPHTSNHLCQLEWPGNVRQLENLCRWLTVMAAGREVMLNDLPSELLKSDQVATPNHNWESQLSDWAEAALLKGEQPLLDIATPKFERIMMEVALKHSKGRRRDAAQLLGWGRNTLTRKIKQLMPKSDIALEDDN